MKQKTTKQFDLSIKTKEIQMIRIVFIDYFVELKTNSITKQINSYSLTEALIPLGVWDGCV